MICVPENLIVTLLNVDVRIFTDCAWLVLEYTVVCAILQLLLQLCGLKPQPCQSPAHVIVHSAHIHWMCKVPVYLFGIDHLILLRCDRHKNYYAENKILHLELHTNTLVNKKRFNKATPLSLGHFQILSCHGTVCVGSMLLHIVDSSSLKVPKYSDIWPSLFIQNTH